MVRGYVAFHDQFWRIVFIVPIITSVIRTALLMFVFVDDPPSYYVSTNDKKRVHHCIEVEAMKVLGDIYKQEYVEVQYK
jgi:hypothetical protein